MNLQLSFRKIYSRFFFLFFFRCHFLSCLNFISVMFSSTCALYFKIRTILYLMLKDNAKILNFICLLMLFLPQTLIHGASRKIWETHCAQTSDNTSFKMRNDLCAFCLDHFKKINKTQLNYNQNNKKTVSKRHNQGDVIMATNVKILTRIKYFITG